MSRRKPVNNAKRKDSGLYETRCDYCNNNISLSPPFDSKDGRTFWTECPVERCRKPLKLYFINGRITSKKSPIIFMPDVSFPDPDDLMKRMLDIAREGCENEYMKHYRGAAVIFRVVAEMLAIGKVLNHDIDSDERLIRFGPAINQISRSRKVLGLDDKQRSSLVKNLQFIKDFGDTAAHPNIYPPTRRIPLEESNVYDARKRLEKSIKLVIQRSSSLNDRKMGQDV